MVLLGLFKREKQLSGLEEVQREAILEDKIRGRGISPEEPTEEAYAYGDLSSSGFSREEAEDNLLTRAKFLGVTNMVDWRYSVNTKPVKVTARAYRPKQPPAAA